MSSLSPFLPLSLPWVPAHPSTNPPLHPPCQLYKLLLPVKRMEQKLKVMLYRISVADRVSESARVNGLVSESLSKGMSEW